jgi:acyl-CoA thioester hydrolase
MGYVYYGNYAQYFEVGRVEALRKTGTSYRQMEEAGIMLPVIDFSIKYLKPAFYDDHLKIITFIREIPRIKIKFEYEIFREDQLINTGNTTLVFMDKNTMKPIPAPENFLEKLKPFFP